ncbi:hypothetical protein ACES2J_08255 [Bdellovibrio bacteriovorus]|uniref:hypothetical protein n=1 Tax=Bdellovibrio bacteriovorus TaxID=959 RepID=UPI0035A636F2
MSSSGFASAVMNPISEAMSAGRGLLELRDFAKNAEAVKHTADLLKALAQVQVELINKDTEIRDLKELLKLKGEMKFEKVYFYKITAEGKEGPFCPNCWSGSGKVVHLHPAGPLWWDCLTCNVKICEDREESDRRKSEINRRYQTTWFD